MNALRQEAEPEEIGPYKSKNTLGMAVATVICALPGTPTREVHVLGAVLSSMPQDKLDKLCKTVRNTIEEAMPIEEPMPIEKDLAISSHECKIGDFCLVKFSASSKSEVFLGQCTDIDDMENILKFSFLQSKDNDKKMFTFKANDDSWVDQHDVIEVLDAPVMNNRGCYTFSLAVPIKE